MTFNRKSVAVTTSNDDPVVSVSDMAAFLKLDDDSTDNALLEAYIETATEAVKNYLNRAIRTETFTYRADRFGARDGDEAMLRLGPGVHDMSRDYLFGGYEYIDLPYPPLQGVTSITTYDSANASTIFSSSLYNVDTIGGRIYLNEGQSWPSDLRDHNAVEIVYTAGYGAASVPSPIKEAIRRYVANLYEGCEGMSDEAMRPLRPYRIMDSLAW